LKIFNFFFDRVRKEPKEAFIAGMAFGGMIILLITETFHLNKLWIFIVYIVIWTSIDVIVANRQDRKK